MGVKNFDPAELPSQTFQFQMFQSSWFQQCFSMKTGLKQVDSVSKIDMILLI